jgi:hypothetical protein
MVGRPSRTRRARGSLVAIPLVLWSCTDLSGLASGPNGGVDAGGADGGDVTPTPQGCPTGTKKCGDNCVGVDDPSFGCASDTCAPCSVPYADAIACVTGKCAVATCQTGRDDCNKRGDDGCEADLTDPKTCGSCTTACLQSLVCVPGVGCQGTCPASLSPCGGTCADTQTSPTHCGGCTTVCNGAPNAVGSCAAGTCTVSCNKGFDDCDKNPANGCEPMVPYYADGDGDGYGAGTMAGSACIPPQGASAKSGDCLDSNANVNPGQTSYFATGYTNASGALSYDYNCSGGEEEAQGLTHGSCAPCAVGYVQAGTRVVQNADPYCGSVTYITGCGGSSGSSGSGGSCASSASAPVRCR